MYLYIAENRAKRQIPMKMKDWVDELNTMLITNRYEVLENKGTVSAEEAKEFAENEFETFSIEQAIKYISDFDKIIDECKSKNYKLIILPLFTLSTLSDFHIISYMNIN